LRPLLLVDAYLDPAGGAGSFLRWMRGRPADVVRPAHGSHPPERLERYAGAVITGSGASWADGVPWGSSVLDFLHAAADTHLPVLGVCFGHQALGVAFGGGVRKAPVPEVGWKEIEVVESGDPVVGPLAPSFTTFLSHEDEIAPGAGGLVVLARSALCPVQAVRVPGRPMWGVQFHAEMGLAEARDLLLYRARRHPELGLDPDAEFARSSQAHDVAPGLFGRFLDVVFELER
jgi:GMP synthase-like glutamine amidotransferase